MMDEEKPEKSLCPMCDAGIPRKKMLMIGSIGNCEHPLIKRFLEQLEEKDDVQNFYVLEPSPTQDMAFPRKFKQDDLLSSQDAFLKKREKYNKRRRR